MPKKILKARQRLALQTRRENDIVNEINREKAIPGYQSAVNDLIAKHPKAKPRTKTPCLSYDCHGLTFAARRSNIASDQVEMIRNDDEYKEVPREQVLPGDIVIYKNAKGEWHHSGMVVSEYEGLVGPWIVSKWGECQEMLHRMSDCPYPSTEIKFFRIET